MTHLNSKNITFHIQDANIAWKNVVQYGTIYHFKKGHIEEGNDKSGFFFVIKGKIHAIYSTKYGHQRFLMIVGKNSIFNEVPCLNGKIYPDIFFTCVEDTTLCRFSNELIANNEFWKNHPELAIDIMHGLAYKASLFAESACNYISKNTIQNVCSILLEIHNDEVNKKGNELSQVEIASSLGVHVTTVARAIHTLRDKGIIGNVTKHRLEIFNESALIQYANGEIE